MKALFISKVVKPIAQFYANFLITMIEFNMNSKFGTLDMFEQFMTTAVTLDYVCSEELGIDLD